MSEQTPAWWAWVEWEACAAIRGGYRASGGLIGARLIERGLVTSSPRAALTPAGEALLRQPRPKPPPLVKGRKKKITPVSTAQL